jgi:heavy metal efflux system protein
MKKTIILPKITLIITDYLHNLIKMKKNILSVLICVIFGQTYAQKITLNNAINMALQNNNQVKIEQLKAQYAKIFINTATDIPKTNLVTEYGQLNSAYNDTRFGIAQNFAFPTIYKNQKKLLTEEYNATLISVSAKEYEIKKAVTQVFYDFIYLKEKQKLLLKADTLYTNFYTKANLRLQKGESNILEKTTAETQKANIFLQLREIQYAIEVTILELQLLLNTTQNIDLETTTYKMPNILQADSSRVANNPILKIVQQQKLIAQAQTAVEKSKLLPDLTLGYFNNSFNGTGADNKLYNSNNRFNSVQLGVSIPIFAKGQKAKVLVAKLQENIAQNQYQAEVLTLQNQYAKILSNYNSNINIVKYFEDTGLKNASLIIQTANKQFINGDINYLDFVTLTNQAIIIQNNYVEAVKALNESIIAINFINLK